MIINARYIAFWGCTIPALQPYVEKAARLVFGELGITLAEPEGMTCCPDPDITHMASHEYWLITAARNLALAERRGLDLMTPCNGCFFTFTEAISELKRNGKKANAVLSENFNMTFKGKVRVYHALEVLYDVVGPENIKAKFTRSLNGLRVTIHPGCKLLKYEEKRLDVKLYELTKLTGSTILTYGLERLCCGVPLMYLDADKAIELRTKPKLDRMKEVNPDAIVVICPACHNQLEKGQLMISEDEEYDIPVISLLELLALCMGFSPDDIGMYLHRIPADDALEKLGLI
ncbi:MAG: hypothetical protein J7L11_09425 [Thermoprotei archaeon]|nr:hypothetical protein [Thermoprotei archaeon]